MNPQPQQQTVSQEEVERLIGALVFANYMQVRRLTAERDALAQQLDTILKTMNEKPKEEVKP